ncbi:hypothetical protein QM480_06700 [Flectobacillus sp. DC10W]|uniref:Uncharacterized protein n=1 Tax=Flectobacillus longus TaxID=2984207 RepID=A0ABT6YK87_9BACT|nr:hypothetical protein [Flectobacillus longus]MDI9864005.1 hypothetical protein [Flectobacillus longus]
MFLLTKKIGSLINLERCPEHNIPAKFEMFGDEVKISCCCGMFLDMMNKKFEDDLKMELQKILPKP